MVVTVASLRSLAASTPRGGSTDNLTEALSGSDAPSAAVPNAGPQRRHKEQLKWKQKLWRCRAYCLAPAFTTQQTLCTLFMHSDFDVAMSVGVRKYVSDCAV